MNAHFSAYIDLGKKIAKDRGIKWDITLKPDGTALQEDAWNLTQLVSDTPPPTHWMRDFGSEPKVLAELNLLRSATNRPLLSKTSLPAEWQDLIKAAILDQLFLRRNSTGHVISGVARPLRVLATCLDGRPPWTVIVDDIAQAYKVAKSIQPSGQLADTILGVIKVIFDANHISEASPLYPHLEFSRLNNRNKRAKYTKSSDELRKELDDRKSAEKLPERKAFWELIRIVFTEKPQTFVDFLRFAQVKVMLLCGLRIGEVCLLPADWKRTRDYYDANGQPAAKSGGYSQALMLRHFAEKQQSSNSDSIVLYETTQYIPAIFEQILAETLDQVAKVTQPLRDTIKLQAEKHRILPWFEINELVPVIKLYTYLTGNPILIPTESDARSKYAEHYREKFDPEILNEIYRLQMKYYTHGGNLDMPFYVFYNRMKGKIKFRKFDGMEWQGNRMRWNEVFLRISDVENYIRSEVPTKMSDTVPFRLIDGQLAPWELMFLMPKRALVEGRNDGVCDITRYFSVGRVDPSMLQHALGGTGPTVPSLFESYGQSVEDQKLTITPHSLRHLQNTELFRLGVADTIISKRFNRHSVAQSYEYDHRRLAEELEQVSIPADVETKLGDKASTVARMIKSGKASGPLVKAFQKIQLEQGDDMAFEFLKAEADGFHSTPYGHCLNSFTVDPCPKHLECFTGCRHLSATNLPENRTNLLRLEGQLAEALAAAENRSSNSIGRVNQISHAKARLDGVRKLLSMKDPGRPFPDGPDLSRADIREPGVLDD